MPFKRDTPTEILRRVEADMSIASPTGDSKLRRSVEAVFARVIAMAAHELYGFLAWIANQILPDTADEEMLDRHGGIWGILRKSSTLAAGSVQFSGTNGSIIPAGSILRRVDDVEYALDSDVTISVGVGEGTITARIAGVNGNADVGTKVSLASPVAGVQTDALVAGDGLTLGTDVEKDPSYLDRILSRIQSPPQGGAAHDYDAWAKEVPGVTRVWTYPKQYGRGTVALTFVMDEKVGTIIPSLSEVAAVQNHLEIERPTTADVTVFSPTAVDIDFEINLTPNSLVVQNSIKAEIEDLFRREAKPGGTLYISRIREAISNATGEFDHVLVSPNANVVMPFGHMPIVGNFTWDVV